jgi:hypothetical protein
LTYCKIVIRSCPLIPNTLSYIRKLICDTADGGGFYDCGNIIISYSIIIGGSSSSGGSDGIVVVVVAVLFVICM